MGEVLVRSPFPLPVVAAATLRDLVDGLVPTLLTAGLLRDAAAVPLNRTERRAEPTSIGELPAFGRITLRGGGFLELAPPGHLMFELRLPLRRGDVEPRELAAMEQALKAVLADGAPLELLHVDGLGVYRDPVAVRFCAADLNSAARAHAAYGLHLAKQWIEPVLGAARWATVEASVAQLAAETVGHRGR